LNPGAKSAEVIIGPFPESGKSYFNLTDLALTPGNNLFVSSHKGLFNLYQEGTATTLQPFILNGKEVKSRLDQLMVDKQGLIWALRSGNVEVIDPGTNQIYCLTFENLRKNAWLNLNLNDITGEIMIGGWFKIFTVKSDSNLLSRKKLPLYITGIQTNHENSDDESLDFTSGKIDLSYKQNSITVEYTAINYRAGSINQYAYRMLGYDENWVYTGNESVSFKLPPGKYSFQIRSSNASGIWDDDYIFTDIIIRPPFYRTWWFALVLLILIAVIIYIIYRYRINQLLKLQYIRDKISKDLHDDIGSSLTNIAIMNEMVREETSRGGDTEKMLSRSAEDIHEVISSLSDIVWNVNPEFDDLSFLIARMRRYASEVLESADIDFNMDFPEFKQKVLMNMAQRRDLYLVFKEGLNNLVKYSKAEHAHISIKIINDEISLFIKDDGVGFEVSSVNFGNGLKNMKQRTESWGGTFTMESLLTQGTQLSIKMKVRK
jgi:two-component sensor histidine kinase